MTLQIMKLAADNPRCPHDLKKDLQRCIRDNVMVVLDASIARLGERKELCKDCVESVGIDKTIYQLAKMYEEDTGIPVGNEKREKIVEITRNAACEIYLILNGDPR